MRTLRLICYDIVDNRRRSEIAHLLEGYGSRVQESLFEVYTDIPGMRRLSHKMETIMNPLTDTVRVYSLCGKDAGDRYFLGQTVSVQEFPYIII